jgi:hypothetical protein
MTRNISMRHCCFVALLVVLGMLAITPSSAVAQSSPEQSLFTSLYRSIEQMVLPTYNSEQGVPTAVILFEMPGLVVSRDEYDANYWAASGYNNRQPDAVLAEFVDRLPYYTSPVFVDSGSRISSVWSHFIYQYIIPIVEDQVAAAKAATARLALANGTLTNAYNAASADYQNTFNAWVSFRSDCIAKQPAGVCSSEGVIYRERLKRKWFTLEVARRDISAAESKIIALQVQDLKNIFADALYTFASNERVDMGGNGFGQNFYQTYLTPSNFWRWWPSAGQFDVSVLSDGSTASITIPGTASIARFPANGVLTQTGSGANLTYSYRPNAGYTGSDLMTYTYTKVVSGANFTTSGQVSIQVVGNDVTAADQAFVTSFSSSISTSASFRAGFGWFSASGSYSSSSSSSGSSTASMSSETSLEFSLAKVSITRPWIDTSLLSFYPVAIRNLAKQGWSDGRLTPAQGALTFKFKLLPTAFLVARSITITSQFSSSQSSSFQTASSTKASGKVSFGPFFTGSASVNKESSSSSYQESSTFNNNAVSIRGPQVIAWLCTPVPPFPTADEAEVKKWESDEVNRQNAAYAAYQKAQSATSSSSTGTTGTTGTTTGGTTTGTTGTTAAAGTTGTTTGG